MEKEKIFNLELTATQVQILFAIINKSSIEFASVKHVHDVLASQINKQASQVPTEKVEET